MSAMIKMSLLLFALVLLQGCASTTHHPMPMSSGSYNTYSPATTTNSYMYRSPPSGMMMGGGMMHGGR